MPSIAPGNINPRINKIESNIYGAVAVTQTTFPDDLTPLNKDKYKRL